MGQAIVTHKPLAGGDISSAYRLTLKNGENFFVKTKADAPKDFFQAEARGLEWLRRSQALRIPEVIAIGPEDTPFLVLEYLETGPRPLDFEERLGQGLAVLHRCPCPSFGLEYDNYIGSLPQVNGAYDSWADFYREQRLHAQLEAALQKGLAPKSWEARFSKLYDALPGLLPSEAPCKLHGDLWGGNLLVGPGGEPVLIDPAVYAGHREVDLAMMQLFGGFGPRVFEAYSLSYPLQGGFENRVDLYQIYPLLVHLNLFGSAYIAPVERSLKRLLP